MNKNKICFGDNLEVMREMDDKSIDLICTDPPFNSGRNYNVFLDSKAQKKAFTDIWEYNETSEETRVDIRNRAKKDDIYAVINDALIGYDYLLQNKRKGNKGSMRAYLTFMAPRLVEMHRLLKDTGSLYLHCDPSASHYLKGMMDMIFDQANRKKNDFFRTELIWWYHWGVHTPKNWNKKHDVILYYCKDPKQVFFDGNRVRVPYGGKKGGMTQDPKWNKSYNEEGKLPEDVLEIATINAMSKERLGYPTQKPIALYEKLVKASSNEEDVVLDPFAGCGTTLDAAQVLNRKWVGIDITLLALEPMQDRLFDRHQLRACIDYDIEGYPTNMEEVRLLVNNHKRYHDFSNWAVTRLGLNPTQNAGDGGYDGIGHCTIWIPEGMKENEGKIMAEVKAGKPTLTQVRAFCRAMDKNKATAGVFITLGRVTKGMEEEADSMGVFEHNNEIYPRLQFWQITQEYFDNPDSINKTIRLPKSITPRKKNEQHIPIEHQLELNVAAG